MTGSSLELRYRAPLWVYAFYLLWYLFLTRVADIVVADGWDPDMTSVDKVMAVGVIGLLLVAPLGLHAVGTRNSDEELADLVGFLSQQVEATC
tara:strand:+ start:318 stop:596 length:279 start_codon:yes stop_codon:yes gene_type:complete